MPPVWSPCPRPLQHLARLRGLPFSRACSRRWLPSSLLRSLQHPAGSTVTPSHLVPNQVATSPATVSPALGEPGHRQKWWWRYVACCPGSGSRRSASLPGHKDPLHPLRSPRAWSAPSSGLGMCLDAETMQARDPSVPHPHPAGVLMLPPVGLQPPAPLAYLLTRVAKK